MLLIKPKTGCLMTLNVMTPLRQDSSHGQFSEEWAQCTHSLGFEKPFSMKKARESKPKLYDVPDSDETLELSEKSRSKMLLKEQDPLCRSLLTGSK
ncbi:hypothetical protein Tco_0204763 [Tanacetum coccineum]